VLLGFGLAACERESGIEPEPAAIATSVTVAPSSSTLRSVGDTVRLQATALDQRGNVMAGRTFMWSSSNNAAVTVVGGLATAAGASGTATITATTEGVQGTATVVADLPVVASLRVSGVADPTNAGVAVNVIVTVLDSNGNVATAYTGTITFTSTDPSATLPANYTFVAADAGTRTFVGGVTLRTVGEHTVTARDVAMSSIAGSQTGITVRSPPTLLAEDFEGGLGLWSVDNGIWEVGTPTSGPNACHSGARCAATVLAGNYPFSRSSLVSPAVTLPAIGANEEIHLRFWHWFSLGTPTGGNPDRAVVLMQERLSPGVWSASTELARYERGSGGWTLPRVDLSAYAGRSVRILFDLQGSHAFNSGPGWYIDDVSIGVVSVNRSLPHREGFEAGGGAWAASNGIWQVGTPGAGPNGCYTGTGCAGTVLDGNYPFNRSSLMSLAFALPAIGGAQEIQLRFWHWFALGGATGGNPDRGVVWVEEWTGVGWGMPKELARFQGSSGGTWTSPLVELSAFAGRTVRISFELQGSHAFNTGAGWFIDDISIEVR